MNGSNTTITTIEGSIKITCLRSTQEEYREELSRYLKAFDATLGDRAIENVWDQLLAAESEEIIYINGIELSQTSSRFERDDMHFSSLHIMGPAN